MTIGLGALGLAAPAVAAPGDKIPNRYICVFKDGAVAKGNVRAEANRAASNAGGQADHFYEHALRGFAASMSAQAAENFARRDQTIKFCEQDQEMGLVQSALEFRVLGKPSRGTTQPPQETPWGIARVNGGTGDYAGQTAWVIDTGIDVDHPDLNVDEARSVNFIARESSANDLNATARTLPERSVRRTKRAVLLVSVPT